jgi:hypothetical protein
MDTLYRLDSCLVVNNELRFAACQFEIMDKDIQAQMGGNILFQIWELGGSKVFEKVYLSRVEMWCQS